MGAAGTTTGANTPSKKKGSGGNVVPNGATISVSMTAGTGRTLLQALVLGRPMSGPGVNILIRKLSQTLVTPSSGKDKKGKKPASHGKGGGAPKASPPKGGKPKGGSHP